MPADLRRRVFVEAGHRCAIPTCRHIEVEIHHIVPWSQCRAHEYDNLIALCPNCHRRADRGEIDRKSLKRYKANLRFVHDKYSQLELDILFELGNATEPNFRLSWPPYGHIMIKRIVESGLIRVVEAQTGISIGSRRFTPDYLILTEAGRRFLEGIGVKEL